MELNDKEWDLIKSVIPPHKPSAKGGRPRVPDREIMAGILWVLRTGARWKDLPSEYPSYQTCHRRFQEWQEAGVFDRLNKKLGRALLLQGKIDRSETFIDGSFSSAKKGHMCWQDETRKRHENYGHFRRKGHTDIFYH